MRYKLLFVDDDEALLKMLGSYFSRKGYETRTARSAVEAMEMIREKPDLVALDINMPGMDGLTLCGQIRDKISGPVIFLTARAEEEDRINGLLSGGDDYIGKPLFSICS